MIERLAMSMTWPKEEWVKILQGRLRERLCASLGSSSSSKGHSCTDWTPSWIPSRLRRCRPCSCEKQASPRRRQQFLRTSCPATSPCNCEDPIQLPAASDEAYLQG
ncbi:uncharacterized protein [Procambarus clarkii]|uniref:uncharacterized protein n=1 Tax=Procambarus clarkii TaxID=6728 RepID=UPI003743B3F1